VNDFELAKGKWEKVLDTVEKSGGQERIVTAYNLVLNLCALAATRARAAQEAQRAIDALSALPASPYKEALHGLAAQLLERRA
jgi:octaprenyl-diphosphate synthase